MLRILLAALFACACGFPVDGASTPLAIAGPLGTCADPPAVHRGKFRHTKNAAVARLGGPRHRGYDLVAVERDENQTLGGKLAYTRTDNDLEDEAVIVFHCDGNRWHRLAETRTDDRGRFAVELTGGRRFPAGMRELYAAVPADGSGVRFLAYVAREGESVIVTDLDGTVTEGETAMVRTVVLGDDIGHRRDAPQALAGSGKTVVYMSSRGDLFTTATRQWLAAHGFPPGPLRLARAIATKPGAKTIALKTAMLRDLRVPIHAAIGNRTTDVAAYTNAGVPANRIFVKLPEFERELAPDLAAKRAVGFLTYSSLAPYLK